MNPLLEAERGCGLLLPADTGNVSRFRTKEPNMELNHSTSERLTVEGAARHTGLSASTLNKMRLDGSGPRFLKISSRRVAYDTRDLDDWLTTRRRLSTSDPGHASQLERA